VSLAKAGATFIFFLLQTTAFVLHLSHPGGAQQSRLSLKNSFSVMAVVAATARKLPCDEVGTATVTAFLDESGQAGSLLRAFNYLHRAMGIPR